ncbi:MAG: threonine synthase [Hyphomicrobiaceae bacterium]
MSDARAAEAWATYATHLECSATGERHDKDVQHNLSRAGRPLLVRYDLPGAARSFTREALAERPRTMWRYRELLPVPSAADVVSLDEDMTPLVRLPRLAPKGGELLVKDEGRLPTGSFKARGLAISVSMAKHFGLRRLAIPTNGNAGSALAAYGGRAGMEVFVFCPEETPEVNVREAAFHGARLWRANGQIGDCSNLISAGREVMGWHDVSTLKEPYRVEGKKTMGLEVLEQLGWQVPDAIFYPTGGGTGIIAMAKVFDELEALGFIGKERPRLVVVQSTGCGPLVEAFDAGKEEVETPWVDPKTWVNGVRVVKPFADRLILKAVRDTKGFAVAVSDEAAMDAQATVARQEGLLLCPEGAACYAAWQKALAAGQVAKGDRIVLFNTCNGLKYPLPEVTGRLDLTRPVDFSALA